MIGKWSGQSRSSLPFNDWSNSPIIGSSFVPETESFAFVLDGKIVGGVHKGEIVAEDWACDSLEFARRVLSRSILSSFCFAELSPSREQDLHQLEL